MQARQTVPIIAQVRLRSKKKVVRQRILHGLGLLGGLVVPLSWEPSG